MNQITPEYLFQMIGEMVVENKILRIEIARLQAELAELKKNASGEEVKK